jgi:hypothetical protein
LPLICPLGERALRAKVRGVELVILVALTVGVMGLAGRLPEARRVKRELARSRLEPIAGLVDGKVVTVRGRVTEAEPGSTVTSPLSGVPCVYALVTFDELGVGGDFRELGRTEVSCPFLLVDRTGAARVVPERPRLAVPGTVRVFAARQLSDAQDHQPAIRLARSVCKRPNYPRSSSLRVTEYVVAVDRDVTVKGYCTREPDPDAADAMAGDYRAAPPSRPVISGTRRVPMLIA